MSESQPSDLYLKLLGETATISWQELQPFFARGILLWVGDGLDLVGVAESLAGDDKSAVSQWLAQGALSRMTDDKARELTERDPSLWAVVVNPWVLAQERTGLDCTHSLAFFPLSELQGDERQRLDQLQDCLERQVTDKECL